MRALVLSGGGGFGAYQVGAWRALAESGWRPDVVVGISIGAANAFLVSRGVEPEELRRAWMELPAKFEPSNGRFCLYPYSREVPRFRSWTSEVARRFGGRPLRFRLRVCIKESRD